MVANLGGGTANNLVYLNGNSVTFAFASTANNSVSASQTATVAISAIDSNDAQQQSLLQTHPNSRIWSRDHHHLRQRRCLYLVNLMSLRGRIWADVQILRAQEAGKDRRQPYNSGKPLITLTGTGAGAGPLVKAQSKGVPETMLISDKRRESAAAAKFE